MAQRIEAICKMTMRWRTITHRTRTPLQERNPPRESPEVPKEEIARLAYSYWEARGRPHGSPAEDWLRAERELRPFAGTPSKGPAVEMAPRSKEYSPQAS